ncbi:FHA domain-containing protein [Azonexus sp. IMCC34842]|uniref:FHA domain-containing protein n=1 Tax=Azonexus sp. IMCC34842 TaxID=3420950 RepID=UPI003D0ED2B5
MMTNDGALSVLCADVAADASLVQSLDQAEARYAVARCEKRIRRSVETHGGRLVHQSGNRLMAFFADGQDALHSAIEMQRRIADLPPPAGFPLAVSVGLCTGHRARELRYFPGDGVNPAARLSAVAAPGHILLSMPQRATAFPLLQLAASSVPDLQLNCGKRRLGVFQVAWQQPDQQTLRLALADPGAGVGRLCVRYRGIETWLDENQPFARIGRQADCDLIVRDLRCSREHGRIERRLERFVWVDRSTNGSFVTLEGQAEVFVRRGELLLSGRGLLSLGAPAAAKGAELVHFETAPYSC